MYNVGEPSLTVLRMYLHILIGDICDACSFIICCIHIALPAQCPPVPISGIVRAYEERPSMSGM